MGLEWNQVQYYCDHLLYQPWMIVGDDYVAISGMNEWQGKLKYLEYLPPVSLWPPQIPHDFTGA
jgi:hypothetical protein